MTLAGSIITPADREAWLAERRSGIGASEAAAAIGISPWQSPLSLWLQKTGQAEPTAENQAMKWGTRLEPLIAEAYSEHTGFSFIAEQVFLRSEKHPFMLATLDRVREDGRLCELKTAGLRTASQWGEAGTDEIPDQYLVQVQHQMIVAGVELVDVAVLIGGQDFRVYTIASDPDIAARLIEKEAAFWECVQRCYPPEIDCTRDGPLLKVLWPDACGAVELGDAITDTVAAWEEYGRRLKELEKERETMKTKILAEMRDAAIGRLSDGRLLTRRVVEVAEQVVTRKAYSYVDLRTKAPK